MSRIWNIRNHPEYHKLCHVKPRLSWINRKRRLKSNISISLYFDSRFFKTIWKSANGLSWWPSRVYWVKWNFKRALKLPLILVTALRRYFHAWFTIKSTRSFKVYSLSLATYSSYLSVSSLSFSLILLFHRSTLHPAIFNERWKVLW